MKKLMLIAAAAALCAPMAVAQDAGTTTTTTTTTAKPKYTVNQRKENQQQRIGEGVEDGSLTAGEAAKLEHKQTKLNAETKVMRSDGSLSAEEREKLQHQQNKLSNQIYNQKHDGQAQNLNPQTKVGQRQLNQQQRIGEGIENGSLNAREATRMETRQAAVNKEVSTMRQANGGTLTQQQRKVVNHQQNKNSKAIYKQKHDKQHR